MKKGIGQLTKNVRKYIKAADKFMVIVAILLSLFGIVAVSSALSHSAVLDRNMTVQIFALVLGIIMLIIISVIDYDILCELWVPILIFSSVLLVLTAIFAEEIGGNKNWFKIGVFSFQTSEFTKLSFAITLSAHLKKIGDELNRIKNIILISLHFCLYFVPIVFQKDIGSALIYCGMFASLLFIAGIQYRYIAIFAAGGIAAVPFVWQYFSEYQKGRIIYGLQPELDPLGYGLQPLVSRMALGSGGFKGLGYGQGIQSQNNLLPASNTDFIFAIIGEEFGFVGCIAVILGLMVLVVLIAKNALNAKNQNGSYICWAIAAMIVSQMLINIGMCIGVSPVIGVTLPFLSYGGSSLLSLFIALGIVQSVRVKPEKVLKFTVDRD